MVRAYLIFSFRSIKKKKKEEEEAQSAPLFQVA